jgi:hypothetical protein
VCAASAAPIDTTPSEALLDAVKWTAGYVAWLRDKVAGVDEPRSPADEDARSAKADDKALTQRSTQTGKREASVWVDLLGQWHDRLVRICAEAIRAGIEERRVRIAEQQGALVADVIRKILDQLDLTPSRRPGGRGRAARAAAARRLIRFPGRLPGRTTSTKHAAHDGQHDRGAPSAESARAAARNPREAR